MPMQTVPVKPMMTPMAHLLHHRVFDIHGRPRLRQRGGGYGWRCRQHAQGNQAGCQGESSDHAP
jgi:hypothetical protein